MKYCLLIIMMSGCTKVLLTKDEMAVRLTRAEPPLHCKSLGKVHSPGMGAWSEQGREDNLRRVAHKLGADVVSITNVDENNTIFGQAFKCKELNP